MTLPTLPFFLLLALLPGVLRLVLGRWCLAYAPRFTYAGIVFCGIGPALFLMALTSLVLYSSGVVWGPGRYPALLGMPLAIYLCVIVLVARPRELPARWLVLSAALGVVPLYFLSAYSGLLAACSFGDCL